MTRLRVLCFLAGGILEAASVNLVITPGALPIVSRAPVLAFSQSLDAEALNAESGTPTQKLEQLNKDQAMEDTRRSPSEPLRASMDSLHGGDVSSVTDAAKKEPLSSGLSVTQQIHQDLDDFTQRLHKTDASGSIDAAASSEPGLRELTDLAKRLSVHVDEMKQKSLLRKQHQEEHLARLNASAHNSTDRTKLLATIRERNLGLQKELDRLRAKGGGALPKEQLQGLPERTDQEASSVSHFRIAMVITIALVLCVLKVVDTGIRRRQKSAALNQLHNELTRKTDSL